MDRVIYESSKRITSGFRTKNRPGHNGVDLGWRVNEDWNIVYSNSKGKVVAVQTGQKTQLASAGTYGNYVKVDHENGYYSLYAHLKEVYVKKGQIVDENTKLGVEGTTGATGVMQNGKIVGQRHLHFEVFKGNTKIDPTPYLTKAIADMTTPTGNTYTGNYPTLPSRGYFRNRDTGANVKLLQRLLNWLNDDKLVVDGIIGSKTIASVKKFQKKVSIAQDGLFGKISLAKAKEFKK